MKYIQLDAAIETTWMILEGLGYQKTENPQLAKTVEDVYATAPSISLVSLPRKLQTVDLDEATKA